MNNIKLDLNFTGHVNIKNTDSGEVLIDKKNAIHSQNMARIISRGLANEQNSIFHRLALGNGGTFVDISDNTVYQAPNDGNNGGGWESRLYHETYSEIIDEENVEMGSDPGSAGSDNVRTGGGSEPTDDPSGSGSFSLEASGNSNVTVKMFINTDEPSGQLAASDIGGTLDEDEKTFLFDELGIYSPGKPAVDTAGISTVNVGNKTSTDVTSLPLNASLTVSLTVDGVSYSTTIDTPAGGTGPSGGITYGDLCEGINDGSWISSGDPIDQYVYVYITDRSNSAYPSIAGKESFGQLVFQSTSVGDSSTVSLTCDDNDASELFNVLTNSNCGNVNSQTINGENAGVQNDATNPENERERLLTHLIFDPILKYDNRNIEITYTITVSVTPTEDSCVNLSGFD